MFFGVKYRLSLPVDLVIDAEGWNHMAEGATSGESDFHVSKVLSAP